MRYTEIESATIVRERRAKFRENEKWTFRKWKAQRAAQKQQQQQQQREPLLFSKDGALLYYLFFFVLV